VHEEPVAFVSHKTGSRIRLRIPSKKKDHAFFAALEKKVSAVEGITAVTTSALTAGVLLIHSSDPGLVVDKVMAAGGLRSGRYAGTRTNLHRRIGETFDGIDLALRDATANELDTGGAAFLALLGAGLYQMWKGNIAAIPWYTAGWYALNLFLKSNIEKQSGADLTIT
jgi:Heavy metal associated domain 2